MYKSIGQRIPKYDGIGHVTGRTQYIGDLKMPGMLTCKVLRNPYHKAKILSIDTTKAEAIKGVYGVITAKDIHYNYFGMVPDQPVLAGDICRFKGQSIAAVAAVDQETALYALSKIKIELEELPCVLDVFESMKEEAPQVRPEGNIFTFENDVPYRRIRRGDIDKGFAEADLIVEGTYRTPNQEHAPIETGSSLAYINEKDQLVIHSKSQGLNFALGDLAKIFNLPLSKIKLVGSTIGGAFGGYNDIHTDHIAGLLALKTRRPVRYIFTREEEMMNTTIRGPWIFKFKDGVKKDGRITARRIEVYHDCGAYVSLGLYALEKNANFIAGANMIENVSIDSYLIFTNKVPSSSMRGFGVNVGQFADQLQMDRVAAAVGLSPWDIRFKHAFREGDEGHVGNPLTAVSNIETLQIAARLAGEELPEEYQKMSSKEGRV